jgi:hypothetical protein
MHHTCQYGETKSQTRYHRHGVTVVPRLGKQGIQVTERPYGGGSTVQGFTDPPL